MSTAQKLWLHPYRGMTLIQRGSVGDANSVMEVCVRPPCTLFSRPEKQVPVGRPLEFR